MRGTGRHLAVLVAAFGLMVGASACVSIDPPEGVTTGKDTGGRTMHLTGWQGIDPWELVINVADLDGVAGTINRAKTRTRDNTIIHQRAFFESGFLRMNMILGTGLYSVSVTQRFNDETDAKEAIRKYYKGRKVEFEDSARIRDTGERGGWAHLVRDPNAEGRTCIFGKVGFLTPAKRGQTLDERYDVLVRLRDCSQKRSFSHVVDFLTNMKVVEPEYNRMLMAGG